MTSLAFPWNHHEATNDRNTIYIVGDFQVYKQHQPTKKGKKTKHKETAAYHVGFLHSIISHQDTPP